MFPIHRSVRGHVGGAGIRIFLCILASALLVSESKAGLKSNDDLQPGAQILCAEDRQFVVATDSDFGIGPAHVLKMFFRCEESRYILVLADGSGAETELDRISDMEGARVTVRLLAGVEGLRGASAIVIYGFEPDGTSRTYRVDAYRLDDSNKYFTAWSSAEPEIGDFNADGLKELVIYEDLFRLGRPGLPNWPRVFNLALPVVAEQIEQYPGLLGKLIEDSKAAYSRLGENCKQFDNATCPFRSNMKGLKQQIAVAKAILK